jgi:hypothetical protein
MNNLVTYQNTRLFWIWFIIAFVFFILGIISLQNIKVKKHTILFLGTLWFLSFIFIFIISYYAILTNPQCCILIFILYFILLFFLMLWTMQLTSSLLYANISIIFILIMGLTFMYLTTVNMLPLGILFLILWLFIFFYMNNPENKLVKNKK